VVVEEDTLTVKLVVQVDLAVEVLGQVAPVGLVGQQQRDKVMLVDQVQLINMVGLGEVEPDQWGYQTLDHQEVLVVMG
jgi:hypothetical protein